MTLSKNRLTCLIAKHMYIARAGFQTVMLATNDLLSKSQRLLVTVKPVA